jgi:CarboxypepD_reg-like domain
MVKSQISNTMKSIFIFLLCAIIGSLSANAQTPLNVQTSFSGKITDAKTGEALFAANIVVLQDGKIITGAETDFDGNFSINSLAAGVYNLRCTYTGMNEHLIIGFPIKADKANRIDIQMEANERQETIVIPTCWGTHNPIFDIDNPTSGRVWTSNQVSRSPIK